jgi:hypothetical protein
MMFQASERLAMTRYPAILFPRAFSKCSEPADSH